jgi:hypothetical protein
VPCGKNTIVIESGGPCGRLIKIFEKLSFVFIAMNQRLQY